MADASLRMSLSASLPDARLAQLTRDLEHLSQAGIRARPLDAQPAPGERGEPITLGVLTLALITSGTVKTLIECFKAYLSRERGLTVRLTRADGTPVVEVTARNMDTAAVREMLKAAASARSE